MGRSTNFSERESRSIDLVKAVAVLSVIAAHVVSRTNTCLLEDVITSAWTVFGEIGVVVFFIIGGFLYTRQSNDSWLFWKKKSLRIIIPWVFCSFLTYSLSAVATGSFSIVAYLSWMLGSYTWYYYATIYTFFLLIFKWFYKNDSILYAFIVLQSVALALNSVGISVTIPVSFFTEYLNPIYWIGYFSMGILLRKKRIDLVLHNKTVVAVVSAVISAVIFLLLYKQKVYTYFNIITSVFCVFAAALVWNIAYWFAQFKVSRYVGKIGEYSFCIFLLHMQIVQGVVSKIPDGLFKSLFSPFVGLAAMLVLICIGVWICKKLPFGKTIKWLVGL